MSNNKLNSLSLKRAAISAFVVTALLPLNLLAQTKSTQLERPPQYVLMAFDGSLSLDFWKESRQFAKDLKSQGKTLNFTYFLSGVYWLHDKNYYNYVPPHFAEERNFDFQAIENLKKERMQNLSDRSISEREKSKQKNQFSQIGFGKNPTDIRERIEQTNLAKLEGHEMASHANGHYDGGTQGKNWSELGWTFEMNEFFSLIFGAFEINKIKNDTKFDSGYSFAEDEIVGFRAPQLGINKNLWPALANTGFKYDTSETASPTYWPVKKVNKNGLWNFPLAELKIVGTTKRTLSMDYNFYIAQSAGMPKPEMKEEFKKQTLETYRKYFYDNYYGNRAPVHIGHHFSKWNDGAYWEAMKDLAKEVCGLSEVKCVTYTEYMNWLESLDPKVLEKYRTSNAEKVAFASLYRPSSIKVAGELPFKAEVNLKFDRSAEVFQLNAQLDNGAKMLKLKQELFINGEATSGRQISMDEIRKKLPEGSLVLIRATLKGVNNTEISSSTLRIFNLGTPDEKIDSVPLELRSLSGDMPEAHQQD